MRPYPPFHDCLPALDYPTPTHPPDCVVIPRLRLRASPVRRPGYVSAAYPARHPDIQTANRPSFAKPQMHCSSSPDGLRLRPAVAPSSKLDHCSLAGLHLADEPQTSWCLRRASIRLSNQRAGDFSTASPVQACTLPTVRPSAHLTLPPTPLPSTSISVHPSVHPSVHLRPATSRYELS